MPTPFAAKIKAMLLTPDAVFEKGEAAYEDKEYDEALKCFREVAEHCDAVAQYNLGAMYYNGDGVPPDYDAALEYFLKAAEQSDDLGQFTLATMYEDGLGTVQDYVSAHMWFNLAAAYGLEEAAISRDRIAAKMTPSDISHAQRLASAWLENHKKIEHLDTSKASGAM